MLSGLFEATELGWAEAGFELLLSDGKNQGLEDCLLSLRAAEALEVVS